MEWVFRALRWLAVMALVVGLADALLEVVNLKQQSAVGYGSSGLTGLFSYWMLVLGVPAIGALVYLLVGGVATLGMLIAWVNQRRGWLVVILFVTLASILWPYVYQFLHIVHPSLTPPPTSGATGPSFSEDLISVGIYASSLVPVLLVLVFSAFSRGDVRARVADNRLDADAALGITRSPL